MKKKFYGKLYIINSESINNNPQSFEIKLSYGNQIELKEGIKLILDHNIQVVILKDEIIS